MAAHRLHTALLEAGCQSTMLVRRKRSIDDAVREALPPRPLSLVEYEYARIRKRLTGERQPAVEPYCSFNFDFEPEIDAQSLFLDDQPSPDAICLHWVGNFLNSRLVRSLYDHYQRPIVWVMADQEPMTGGCHYSFDCQGYKDRCGRCPQLKSTEANDYSRKTWLKKKEYLADLPICFVAPTGWGVERLKQSSLFRDHRVEVIPYPVDTSIFRPIDRRIARDLLHLPQDKKIVFFGSTYLEDSRKGMKLLVEALEDLAGMIDRDRVFLHLAGLGGKQFIDALPFEGKYSGHFHDQITLALAYQSADIFLCPSLEDAGPMMIPEAMLCGTPVVAFDAGGAPDLIETMKNGYLAKYADAHDLARGVYAILKAPDPAMIRNAAHRKALLAHEPATVAAHYIGLFHSLKTL